MCIITSAAFTAPEAFDSNFQKGKKYFDAGNYQEAVRSLSEAIRLDPKNQQAHALAGVAYTKLGKWGEARREFEIVVGLNPNSPEAKQAQKWLKRLQQPITVLILPFVDLSTVSTKYGKDYPPVLAGAFFNTLSRFIYNSGLYKLMAIGGRDFPKIIDINVLHSTLQSTCQEANQNGAKIMVSGYIDDFDQQQTSQYYKASMKLTIKIYSTKDCRLIHSVTDRHIINSVVNNQFDMNNAIQNGLNAMFDRMFKEINAKLI
ncbi:MAG: tetratricopeptide repeat protein [Planctomycetes bacterium]|nr:tetratricopeptide repeat protein [Planctomycetota bacterium]